MSIDLGLDADTWWAIWRAMPAVILGATIGVLLLVMRDGQNP